jgi:proteic killer suppression protein
MRYKMPPWFGVSGIEDWTAFFLRGTRVGIRSDHGSRLRLILGRLSASVESQDMSRPGLYLHELKGKRRGTWSVRVTGNWGVIFRFEGRDAVDIDYEDYH